ncbi:MAG: glycosyltransferase [Gemmatimonadetes bacterium]|nr:glycosyltransferase [Gemmatimonadota bacterium]MYK53578.1 glycosyltransferase [Gemmatimonadota bacterium]
MNDLAIYFITSLCAVYITLIVVFLFGLLRRSRQVNGRCLSVSVIVPARNEATNIDACLRALAAQTYPDDHLEIIVVDDRSSDDTAARIDKWTRRLPNLSRVSVTHQNYICPKKNALWQGIKHARGDIIFTTDADCRPGPNWITSNLAHFAPDVGMVIGHAPLLQNEKVLSGLLSLQALIVSTLAAGSAGIGFPLTCSGRNMAYRRKAFDEVKGFNDIGHIIGGDDVLLMRQFAQKSAWKIRFNADADAFVPSASHPDNLINRQVRYQSKTIHYGIPTLILAFAVYIFHVVLATLPIFFWTDAELFYLVGSCLGIKIIADAVFLLFGSIQFKSLKLLLWFPVLEILIIPYIVIICALGTLSPFKWK